MIRQVAARRLLFLSNSSFKYVIHWETENTHTHFHSLPTYPTTIYARKEIILITIGSISNSSTEKWK